MKRILSDGWFQAFTVIAAMSGMVMAAESARFRPAPPPAPERAQAVSRAPAPAAPPAASPAPEEAPAALSPGDRAAASRKEAAARGSPENLIDAGGLEPAAPPAPDAAARPARPEPFAIFQITAKTRGQWVVSSAADDKADSPSIARVIYSAANGDVVLIRPGQYAEPLAIANKSLTFRGTGSVPGEVVLTAPVGVDHGSVSLENLTVEPAGEGGPGASAIYATSAKLSLKRVVARSAGVAVKAEESKADEVSVRAVSSTLDGAYADVLVRGRAFVRLTDDRFSNPSQPIVVWRDAHVVVESCRFPPSAGGKIFAYEDSDAAVSGSPTAPRVASARAAPNADADRSQLAAQAHAPVRHLTPGRGFRFMRK